VVESRLGKVSVPTSISAAIGSDISREDVLCAVMEILHDLPEEAHSGFFVAFCVEHIFGKSERRREDIYRRDFFSIAIMSVCLFA
jgi:hypothetical protein